jgi:hypothetical protein
VRPINNGWEGLKKHKMKRKIKITAIILSAIIVVLGISNLYFIYATAPKEAPIGKQYYTWGNKEWYKTEHDFNSIEQAMEFFSFKIFPLTLPSELPVVR